MDSGTSLATEKILAFPRADVRDESKLEITVVYTSVPFTLEALKTAAKLASRLSASITILVPQQVPFPLPLASPPVLLEFSERRFRTLAEHSPVETRVRLYLCRDAEETLKSVLSPHSLVVIGARHTFWPVREKRLARQLRRAGHEVILAEKE